MELHTYIKCSKCGYAVRASRHTIQQCEGFRKIGRYENKKAFKITNGTTPTMDQEGNGTKTICKKCDIEFGSIRKYKRHRDKKHTM